jgi:hypothetical protein
VVVVLGASLVYVATELDRVRVIAERAESAARHPPVRLPPELQAAIDHERARLDLYARHLDAIDGALVTAYHRMGDLPPRTLEEGRRYRFQPPPPMATAAERETTGGR